MPQIIVLNRRDDFLSREITRIMTGFLAMSSRQKEWNGGFGLPKRLVYSIIVK